MTNGDPGVLGNVPAVSGLTRPFESHREPRPHVLRDYALLADGERGALVGPNGEIGWLCTPRWDSPPLFANLLGGGSYYQVQPTGRYVWGGAYESGTLIWHSRWVVEAGTRRSASTESGVVECVEALRYPAERDCTVLMRRICAVTKPAEVIATVALDQLRDSSPLPDGRGWATTTHGRHIRWSVADPSRVVATHSTAHGWQMLIRLEAGETCDLLFEVSDRRLPLPPPDVATAWELTRRAWSAAVPDIGGVCAADARQSYAVMRGLTHPDGGTVAAATASMPERANSGRNYDYRYVWIRDTSYCGLAAAAVGDGEFLGDSAAFVAARLLEHGPAMVPAYTVTGDDVPAESHLDLPGYPGGGDRIGNWVRNQFQLDEFGEALLVLAAAARTGSLGADGTRAATVAAAAISSRWQDPDAGIWEIENRCWTHSRLACVAGLRAAADAIGGSRAGSWRSLADHILRHTSKTSLTSEGRWQRADDDPDLDGALLEAGLRGAMADDDPRVGATLDAYLQQLTLDGYAYRFSHHRQHLGDEEGAFVLCGFWVAQSLHRQGRHAAAMGWFERTRAAYGPGRLYSEEFDVAQHQQRGNLPQAFVHAAMIESSMMLDR